TNKEETLLLGGALQGGLWGEAPDRILDVQKVDLDFRQGFRKVGDRYLPNLGEGDVTFSADVTLKDKDKNQILQAQGLWLSLQGNGSEERDGALHQGASLELGVETLQIGKLSLSPHLFLDLLSHQKCEEATLEGEGDLSLESKALGLDVGAQIKLDTDFKK